MAQETRFDLAGTRARMSRAAWFPLGLGALFFLEFAWLAWAPNDRETWLLENLLAVPAACALIVLRRRLPFSRLAWILIFSFLALHEIGCHYTYSQVPWMDWSRALFGWAPAWERNHYDRLLHLAFGLLLTQPLREWLLAALPSGGAWLQILPVSLILAGSCSYEIMEWMAAWLVDPSLGIAFVGAQGDVWDAQKDMALALGGSLVATGIRLARASDAA